MREQWVGGAEPLAPTRQCELTGVARSGIYASLLAVAPDKQELTLLGLIDVEYTRHPFYGSRKIKIYLRALGRKINRKRVQRLISVLGRHSTLTRAASSPVQRLPACSRQRAPRSAWMDADGHWIISLWNGLLGQRQT